jgi:hypothetical protein
MTCDRCGSQTTRPRLCRECALLESVENEAAHRDAPPLYECSQCGEERAESPDSTCWLCKSDRHEVGDDGRPEARTDGGEEVGRAIEQPDADPSELRIKVGVHQDATNALREILGDNPSDRALRIHHGQGPTHVALRDGRLWGVAHVPGQDGLREGPMERENLMSGLASADRVEVVELDAAPFEGRKRGGPGV